MKVTLLLIFLSISSVAQQKYLTKGGIIIFEASMASFEEIKAQNTSVSAILNAENGEFASLALIKGFRFKSALMEEHFNENYMDSYHYPKATLKGTLESFNFSDLTEEPTEFIFNGILEIKGKSKEFSTPVTLKINGNVINLISEFSITLEEFDITIPKVVRSKVAEIVNISVNFDLTSK